MWSNFFIAGASAAAALAGLVIVAVSVNLARILQFPHLPSRAGATIARLILILVTSMVALIPQPVRAVGIEVLFLAAACWMVSIRSSRRSARAHAELQRPRFESLLESVAVEIQVLPFVVGAILLMLSREAGYYAVAGGVIATFVFSTLNMWVLLVEILR
ncbi:MAG TPA: hypothetical protein VMJ35_09405 [Dongiaceae bacterium]|nr:hypothetical protein [Dongiaceae bacterium]